MTFVSFSTVLATYLVWLLGLAGLAASAFWLSDKALAWGCQMFGVYGLFFEFILTRRRRKRAMKARQAECEIRVDYDP